MKWKYSNRFNLKQEIAFEMITSMLREVYNQLLAETDPAKIQRLEEERRVLIEEREEIHLGNKEIINKALTRYADLLREKM